MKSTKRPERLMIHAVTAANRQLYVDQLDAMHQLRYKEYVVRQKWTGLQVRNEREYDEFDNESAVYLLCLSPEGEPEASMRLNPTSEPYLLSKLSHFVEGEPPRDPRIWDFTRWLSWPGHRGERRNVPARQKLFCGMFEFAATRGVKQFTALGVIPFIEQLEKIGWSYEPIGLPRPFGTYETPAVAVKFDAGPASLQRTRLKTGMRRSVLFEAPPPCEGETLADVLEAAIRVDQVREAAMADRLH